MNLVDSHCHINFEGLNERLPDVLSNAKNNQVSHIVAISVDMDNYPRVQEIAESHANIFCSVGVHPNTAPDGSEGFEPTTNQLIELAQNPNVVGIGETGLDYFRNEGDLDWQRERFRRHIDAGRETNLPIIVHTREAARDTLKMLREENVGDATGVIHCFTEDWAFAQAAMDLGFYISFSGIVTFKSAKQIQEVAAKAPIDRILVETDAPYLAPVPYRGKTNEPAFVKHTAEFVAELRGISVEEVAEKTTQNFFRCFSRAA
ncbi:MAG: TatD family hydrolase [Pseudomonadota bacterium]